MSLDITFKQHKDTICPKCGEIIGYTVKKEVDSGGRVWYDILESFGYYVPYDKRTEENNWYGKDMILTPEQANEVFHFVGKKDVYNAVNIMQLIASATYENDRIVINANW